MIAAGQGEVVLVVGAEKLSTITDFKDRSTAILFGDGAGAAVRAPGQRPERPRAFCPPSSSPTESSRRCCTSPGGGAADPISEKVVCERSHFMKMAGREVFKAAVLTMAEACDEALRRAGVTADEIDLLIPAPGQRPHHRGHGQARRHADGQGDGQRRPLRQHLIRLDSARAGSGHQRRPGEARLAPPAGGIRRRIHLGQRRRPVVTVLMCPGQGAQRVGMGKDLAERFPAARDTFAAIDEALGTPLSRIMWEGPEDELTLTHNAQPAILAHSAAVLAVVAGRLGGIGGGGAGHSLGEYSAHVAAGTLSPVGCGPPGSPRGELMLDAGRQRPGRHGGRARAGHRRGAELPATSPRGPMASRCAANLNAPDQTVISGDPAGVGAGGRAMQGARAPSG